MVMVIRDVQGFKEQVANAWDEQGAGEALAIVCDRCEDISEIVWNHDYAFSSEVVHILRFSLHDIIKNIDDDDVDARNINDLQALTDKLNEVRQNPQNMIYETGGGIEHAHPLDKDELMELVDDILDF